MEYNMRKLKNNELNRITVKEFKLIKKNPFVVVLDNIRSLNNIGSIFRTSDAFLVESIFLCGITACPPHKDIQKTALGATESVDWEYYNNTIDAINYLKSKKYKIISIEQTENSLSLLDFKIVLNQKYALIFGNEVKGVSQKVVDNSDNSIEIPQMGTKHSFNVSISAGIVLWDFFIKLSK